MSKPKTKFTWRRVISKQEAADYLGRSLSWFCDHEEGLYADGFPRPLSGPCGGFDRVAIDNYFDRRSGLEQTAVAPDDAGFDDAWMRASRG